MLPVQSTGRSSTVQRTKTPARRDRTRLCSYFGARELCEPCSCLSPVLVRDATNLVLCPTPERVPPAPFSFWLWRPPEHKRVLTDYLVAVRFAGDSSDCRVALCLAREPPNLRQVSILVWVCIHFSCRHFVAVDRPRLASAVYGSGL